MLRTGLTAGLLLWVAFQLDMDHVISAVRGADHLLLFFAVIPYVISRLLGAYRLGIILRQDDLSLSLKENISLQWASMFYGMFLPGGLGADAYKLIRLRPLYPGKNPAAGLAKDLLADRLVGLAALISLAMAAGMPAFRQFPWVYGAVPAALILMLTAIYYAAKRWIPRLLGSLPLLLILSLAIQLCQVVSILLILAALGVHSDYFAHSLIFLLSSIAAMLPFSVGGVGIRELVFLQGAAFFAISPHESVAAGFTFDFIVTMVALTGSVAAMRSSE